jgi:hypothetical protein
MAPGFLLPINREVKILKPFLKEKIKWTASAEENL